MQYIAVASKLLAESLLSLYPTFVKNINISFGLQLWSRFITYLLVSSIFIDWKFVYASLSSGIGLLLTVMTIIHVYTSYKGFQLLEGGIAYALFYTYPLMILLLSGEPIKFMMIFAIIGVILLANHTESFTGQSLSSELSSSEFSSGETGGAKMEDKKTESPAYLGYLMIFLAALTEALIYFIVRHIKTENSWNHVFISYLLGAIAYSVMYFQDIMKITLTSNLSVSLVINIFIGLLGYLLRFFSMSRLHASIYAPLSYFGIVMASVYGFIFNGEAITLTKILGILCIIVSNLGQL